MVANAVPHDRVTPVVGDFFVSVPTGADAYMLRSVIHDWAPLEAAAILNNVRKAMKLGAHLILIEAAIPETSEFYLNKWIDLHMLVAAGGRERTGPQYGALRSEMGLSGNDRPHTIAREHLHRSTTELMDFAACLSPP